MYTESLHFNIPAYSSGDYDVIYADPPWRYEAGTIKEELTIEHQYPTMSLREIKDMGSTLPIAKDAVLFLWTTAPKLPEGLEVMDAWGFTYRTSAVWDKEALGLGYYFRVQHEYLLVGKRGNMPVPHTDNRPRSVIRKKRTNHSEKPPHVHELIEAMYPNGRYLELFGRHQYPGWTVWGNEVSPQRCLLCK